MAMLRFSRAAKLDLLKIGAYSLQTWGEAQANRYLDALEQCAITLARRPSLGRPCDSIRPGLYRLEKGRRVLFYRRDGNGILISRISHRSMLPEPQTFEDLAQDA